MARFNSPLSSHKKIQKATLEVLTSLWLSLRFSVSAVFATVSPKPFTSVPKRRTSPTKMKLCRCKSRTEKWYQLPNSLQHRPIHRHWRCNIFLTTFPACCFKSAISASPELAFSTCADSKVVATQSKLGGVGCLPSSSSPRGCLVALSR